MAFRFGDVFEPQMWGHDLSAGLNDVKDAAGSVYDWTKNKLGLSSPDTKAIQAVGAQANTDAGTYRGLNAPGNEADLTQSYKDTISGANPSVAMQALHQQTAQNAAQQLGFAAGLGGLNATLARRTAADNIGRLNQGAIGQGTMLRAKEISDAQAGLGGELKTQGDQQLSEQQLAEQAYRDQLAAQSANRGQNMQLFGSGLNATGSFLTPTGTK